jgi:hypothetical protein
MKKQKYNLMCVEDEESICMHSKYETKTLWVAEHFIINPMIICHKLNSKTSKILFSMTPVLITAKYY